MNIIKRSEDFDEWLKKLRDTKGKIKILSRIDNPDATTSVMPRRWAVDCRK